MKPSQACFNVNSDDVKDTIHIHSFCCSSSERSAQIATTSNIVHCSARSSGSCSLRKNNVALGKPSFFRNIYASGFWRDSSSIENFPRGIPSSGSKPIQRHIMIEWFREGRWGHFLLYEAVKNMKINDSGHSKDLFVQQ